MSGLCFLLSMHVSVVWWLVWLLSCWYLYTYYFTDILTCSNCEYFLPFVKSSPGHDKWGQVSLERWCFSCWSPGCSYINCSAWRTRQRHAERHHSHSLQMVPVFVCTGVENRIYKWLSNVKQAKGMVYFMHFTFRLHVFAHVFPARFIHLQLDWI